MTNVVILNGIIRQSSAAPGLYKGHKAVHLHLETRDTIADKQLRVRRRGRRTQQEKPSSRAALHHVLCLDDLADTAAQEYIIGSVAIVRGMLCYMAIDSLNEDHTEPVIIANIMTIIPA
jgi:hypothetical protein